MHLRVFLFPFLFVFLSPSSLQGSLGSLGKAAITAWALSSQWAPVGGQDSFLYTSGTSEDDLLVGLVSTPEGGYQAIGYSDDSAVVCSNYFHNGTLAFFNAFDAGGTLQLYDSVTTPNGTYIAGRKHPQAYAAFITKECDAIAWGAEFLIPGTSGWFSAVATTSNGSAVFVGPNYDLADSAVFLVKMLSMGQKAWERKIELVGIVEASMGLDIYNDSIYIAGSTSTPDPNTLKDIFLIKVTKSGEVQYIKFYAFQVFNKVNDLKVTDDGYIMITGETQESSGPVALFYAKLDAVDGARVYFQKANFPSGMGTTGIGTGILLTQGGGVAISGQYPATGSSISSIVLQVSPHGIIETTYFLPNLYSFTSGQASGVVEELDGSFTVGGHSDGFVAGPGIDFFIARVGNYEGLGCSSNLTGQAINLTDQVTEYTLNLTIDPLFTAPYSTVLHTLLSTTVNSTEICAPTPSPTLAPSKPPSFISFLPPYFLYTVHDQTTAIGQLYSFSLVLSRYVAYEGDFSTLTLHVSNVSLENKDTDWLFFNDITYLFEGTPEKEDEIRVWLNVTDEQGANATSSFFISVQPSSEEDSAAAFFKKNAVPLGVGLVFFVLAALIVIYESLSPLRKCCRCLCNNRRVQKRIKAHLDKIEKEQIKEKRELVTQREKTAKEIEDLVNELKKPRQTNPLGGEAQSFKEKTEMQPINTLYMRKSPDTIII